MARKLAWPNQFKKSPMARAERFARHNARLIRWMLYMGLMIHGKKMSEKEFFLSRITNLSVDLYGILSALTDIDSKMNQGTDVTKELRLLSYFVEEAKTSRKENRRIHTSKRESLHKKIFKDIKISS